MTITFVLRSIIIFAVLLCYYQCSGDVNCEKTPYHPKCRGMQAKRLVTSPILRTLNCVNGDCRMSRQYVLEVLDENRDMDLHPARPEPRIYLRPKQRMMRMEDSQDLYTDY